jgi:hypothetical protein
LVGGLAVVVARSRLPGGEGYCTGVENSSDSPVIVTVHRTTKSPSTISERNAGCCQDGLDEVGEEQESQVGSVLKVLRSFDKVDHTHHDKQRDTGPHDLLEVW